MTLEYWVGAIIRGTNADRLGGLPTDVSDGTIFIETDTSKLFIFKDSDNSWNELVTTTGGTITGATIDVNDNSIVRTGATQGYILVHNGTKFQSFGRGNAAEVLRTTTDGTNTEWANIATYTETISNKKIGNYLDIDRVAAPANPASNVGRLYHKQIDANNDGVFCKVKKAGAIVEVQIL